MASSCLEESAGLARLGKEQQGRRLRRKLHADTGEFVLGKDMFGDVGIQATTECTEHGRDDQTLESARDQSEQAPGERRRQCPGKDSAWVIHGCLVFRVDLKDDGVEDDVIVRLQLCTKWAACPGGCLKSFKAHEQHSVLLLTKVLGAQDVLMLIHTLTALLPS
jgi:hypothetical protein